MPKDARVRDILPLKGTGEMDNSSKSRKSQVFSLRAGSPVPFLGHEAFSLQFARASREIEGAREFVSGSINYDRSMPRDLIVLLALALNSPVAAD
jgi:hypothetical protein